MKEEKNGPPKYWRTFANTLPVSGLDTRQDVRERSQIPSPELKGISTSGWGVTESLQTFVPVSPTPRRGALALHLWQNHVDYFFLKNLQNRGS